MRFVVLWHTYYRYIVTIHPPKMAANNPIIDGESVDSFIVHCAKLVPVAYFQEFDVSIASPNDFPVTADDPVAGALATLEQHPAPHPYLAATELTRTMSDMAQLAVLRPLLRSAAHGDGHSVMVLPGFMADDKSTRRLRRFLSQKGLYRLHRHPRRRSLWRLPPPQVSRHLRHVSASRSCSERCRVRISTGRCLGPQQAY